MQVVVKCAVKKDNVWKDRTFIVYDGTDYIKHIKQIMEQYDDYYIDSITHVD